MKAAMLSQVYICIYKIIKNRVNKPGFHPKKNTVLHIRFDESASDGTGLGLFTFLRTYATDSGISRRRMSVVDMESE